MTSSRAPQSRAAVTNSSTVAASGGRSRPTRVSTIGSAPAPATALAGLNRGSTGQPGRRPSSGYDAATQRSQAGGVRSQSASSRPPPDKNQIATRSASTRESARASSTAAATSSAASGYAAGLYSRWS